METIKIGDIVRVSENAPKMYKGEGPAPLLTVLDSKVIEIADGNALIEPDFRGCYGEPFPIPLKALVKVKYLVKVNAESKEPTTAEELAEPLDFKKAAEDWATTISNGIREYGENVCRIKEEGSVEAYWDVYTADLAKEIVLKIAGSQLHNHKTQEIGRMAVEIAKSVVENLKEREG